MKLRNTSTGQIVDTSGGPSRPQTAGTPQRKPIRLVPVDSPVVAKKPVKQPSILKQIATNFPKDIKRTAESGVNLVGQTLANLRYNPAAIPKDIGAVASAIPQIPGALRMGAMQEVVKQGGIVPALKSGLSAVGKYVVENPASTLFDIATLSPKSNIIKGIAAKTNEIAIRLTRRGLGFTKPMLKGGGKEFANEVSNEMLKQNVISKTGSIEDTYKNTKKLAEDSGEALGSIRSVLAESGNTAFNPLDLDEQILKQLTSKYTTAADKSALNEVRKLVLSRGTGEPLNFDDAQDLVRTLQEKAKFGPGVSASESTKAELYQKASGIARDMLDRKSLEAAKKMNYEGLYRDYMIQKDVYRKAQSAYEAIDDLRAGLGTGIGMGIVSNPLVKAAINRVLLSGGSTGAGISKLIKKTPVKSLYYTGRGAELGVPRGK